MGFERSYQFSIPSKKIFIQTDHKRWLKNYSSSLNLYRCFYTNVLYFASKQNTQITSPLLTKDIIMYDSDHFNGTQHKLNPWFVTGFTDGDACFGLYIYKNTALKIGWYAFLDFKITLHKKDRDLLNKIKNYFGVGEISKHGEQSINYGIRSIKDLQMIINHFDKFTLKTKKLNDYKLFKLAFNIIKNKEHLTKEGFNKLLLIKSSINKGLSPELKKAFPKISIASGLKIES